MARRACYANLRVSEMRCKYCGTRVDAYVDDGWIEEYSFQPQDLSDFELPTVIEECPICLQHEAAPDGYFTQCSKCLNYFYALWSRTDNCPYCKGEPAMQAKLAATFPWQDEPAVKAQRQNLFQQLTIEVFMRRVIIETTEFNYYNRRSPQCESTESISE